MIPTGVSMVVSGGAVSPENRSNEECPFCAIVHDGAPATVVREWDDALCIVPLAPVTPGHLLVLPKVHVETFFSAPDVSALTMRRAAELVHGVERHHDRNDYNIITSAGEAATQTEKHLHVHVVPRQRGDGLALPWSPSAAEASLADDLLAVRTENACINEKWTESRARVAAVERERDQLRSANHAAVRLIREHGDVEVERDAALARIAAVKAERDALAVIIANEAQTLRAYHIGRLAADNPVDAAHLADHLDAELLAALGSPTPTGPEPAKCEDCGWPWPLPGRPPTGAECDSCGGDLVPAIPEPTEETP